MKIFVVLKLNSNKCIDKLTPLQASKKIKELLAEESKTAQNQGKLNGYHQNKCMEEEKFTL